MTKACKETYIFLVTKNTLLLLLNFPFFKYILCIYHLVRFKKDQAKILPLLDFGNGVNAITPAYTASLGLKICPTNVNAQKIDGSIFAIFGMVLANF